MPLSFRPAGAVVLTLLAASPLAAQRNVPAAYAITNARVVPVAGAALDRGTIIIRDGLIVAVGRSVPIPADARVIDGTGLSVYPGFIDAFGSLGIPAAPTGGGATAARPAAPNSAYPVGLQPEMLVTDLVRAGDDGLAAAHAAGFTSAHTGQAAGVFRGQSAVINLAGDEVGGIVVRSPVAQHVGFSRGGGGGGGGGGYPGSLMGVFSAIRQQLLDAQRYGATQSAYRAANSRGMRRPDRDASLEALQPVLDGSMPVVFVANTQREIERALDLAREFGLRPIIAGGNEAWKVSSRLRAENVPVLLSANFPRRTAAPAAEADPDPVRVLRERVDAPKGPARLADAGVRFAFQSGAASAMGDFLANVRRAVEHGLAPDVALRALTLGSAEILGVGDRMGSLEPGKIANLTITRGDVFARDARVTQLFIDGRPISIPAPSAPAAGAAPARGGGAESRTATGTWTVVVTLDGSDRQVTFVLTQEGEKLTGTMQGGLGSAEIQNGAIGADGEFRFTVTATAREGTEEAVFVGLLDGNSVRGGVSIVGHTLGRFVGTRPAPTGTTPSARRPSTR